FDARGTLSSRRPASCGTRSALRWFTSFADQTRFSHVSTPPRERGTTWSRLPSSGCSRRPVYWQWLPSRSRMFFALSFGWLFAHRAARGAHGMVALAHRQRDPFVPLDGPDAALAFDVECGGPVRRHLAERVLRRANVDRLTVAAEHPH